MSELHDMEWHELLSLADNQKDEIERLTEFLERGGIDSSAVLASEDTGEWRDEIERLQARVEELEGDLNIMRLQRNAKHCSRCPECAEEFVYSYGTNTVVIEQGCEHEWGTRTGGFLIHCRKCGAIQAATEQEFEKDIL